MREIASPVPTRTSIGTAIVPITTSFTSRASIFLPRYSGVRPTIRPAMNTVRIANRSIPYSPEPTPPKITSPVIMFTSGTAPPIPV